MLKYGCCVVFLSVLVLNYGVGKKVFSVCVCVRCGSLDGLVESLMCVSCSLQSFFEARRGGCVHPGRKTHFCHSAR